MFEINKGIGRPQSLLNLLSRAHPHGRFQQETQQRHGLRREPDSQPLPPQFAAKGIQLEESKSQGPGTEGNHHALLAIEQPPAGASTYSVDSCWWQQPSTNIWLEAR